MTTDKEWHKELGGTISIKRIRAIQADAIEEAASCPPWQSGHFVQVKDIRKLAEDVRRGDAF